MQKIKKQRLYKSITAFMLLVLCLFAFILSSMPVLSAKAMTVTGYSSPLADLQLAENFNVEDYPSNAEDYSLSIIQVAESDKKELYVYVYQPSEQLVASAINMSLQKDNMESSKLYYLTKIGNNGVFFKYKVSDFTVNTSEKIRHYNISSIYRPYYSKIDTDITDENITDKAFNVATCFSIMTNDDGSISYSNTGTETIEIESKYTSYIRYSNGSTLYPYEHDMFFVAFSTERDIDRLLEADVSFEATEYDCSKVVLHGSESGGIQVVSLENGIEAYSSSVVTYPGGHFADYDTHNHKDLGLQHVNLKSSNDVIVKEGVIFKTKFEWTEIESTSDFVEDEHRDFTSEQLTKLKEKDWVLNFYHASHSKGTEMLLGSPYKNYEKGTIVSSVTILRLKFETDGVTYNLGVVDDRQNSTAEPGGSGTGENIFNKYDDVIDKVIDIVTYIIIALVAVFLIVILTVFTPVVKVILKGLWFIISAPFAFIKSLFEKGDK